jgi:hypothetical protein
VRASEERKASPGKRARDELLALEPIFHHASVGASRETFEKLISFNYWEVGASGRVYSRETVLDVLVERHAQPHSDHWDIQDFSVHQLAKRTWLVTYQLEQDAGFSRRSTIWTRVAGSWVAEYHQGTKLPQ